MALEANSPSVSRARELLRRLSEGREPSGDELIAQTAIALAGLLVTESQRQQTPAEAARAEQLARLMDDPSGQVWTTLLTDRMSRSQDPRRVCAELSHLTEALGVPRYMSTVERAQLLLGRWARHLMPSTVHSALMKRLRAQTRTVIVPAEDPALRDHMARRNAEGVAVNVNHLGEAVLSDAEAVNRLDHYVALLQRSDVQTISVKVSSISAPMPTHAYERSVDVLVPRLQTIYASALGHSAAPPKLVYLDMESYRDLELTLEVFRLALSAPQFLGLTAGVVLQAYIPDSYALQRSLTQWARERFARGGAPIRLRIVKGANLAHERVESALRGWAVPTVNSKHEADAGFKRMLDHALRPEHTSAVRVGVASHNAFDLAYAAALAHARGVHADVSFELLEGMADPLLRAMHAVTGRVLAYTPIVEAEGLQSGIAYLIRRLDENTSSENFLRHSFALRPNSAQWSLQEERFMASLEAMRTVSEAPRRAQDQRQPRSVQRARAFENEPDTDFGLAHHRAWIQGILAQVRDQSSHRVRACVAGEDVPGAARMDGFDPSRPGLVPYHVELVDADTVERALQHAARPSDRWAERSLQDRDGILHACAEQLRQRRGALIAAMVLDAGKAVPEADTEVSEAIDFAEYYRRQALEIAARRDVTSAPKGVVLITSPWNFPLAIAAGGVFAALAAGNEVILKPSLDTPWIARLLCEACWDAGVPREVLQLVLCRDEVGSTLVRDARVNAVILTGATETARLFRRMRPGIDLMAETGGKNAIIVSAMSDWDLAIKDALQSAFGHAGQKCSAASLLICEREVFDSPSFKQRLRDAAASLGVGSAWDATSVVTPLIQPAGETLLRGLTQLDSGESWLLQPQRDPNNPRLWSPGIRWNVSAGSFAHTTELFGPVLSVMRADDLDHAVALANGTSYGLTSGLFSLNEREQTRWMQRIDAGNLYINRGITGAIVRRQPFGGTKASCFGPGAKAGGPHYVAQLMKLSSVLETIDYEHAWKDHFARGKDVSHVLGQDNILDHVPCAGLCVLITQSATTQDLGRCLAALRLCGVSADIVTCGTVSDVALIQAERGHRHSAQTETTLLAHLKSLSPRRVRVIGELPASLVAGLWSLDAHIELAPVSTSGRVELARYLRERSVSNSYHRYGNLSRIPADDD